MSDEIPTPEQLCLASLPIVPVGGMSVIEADGMGCSADGRPAQAFVGARFSVALGIAEFFLDAHPNLEEAVCDGLSALPLDALERYIIEMQATDRLVKGLLPLATD